MMGCDKAPINGDLDGMWKMTAMQWEDGETVSPVRIFFCFEQDCIELNNKGANACTYLGLMHKVKKRIRVENIKSPQGDVTDITALRQFGITESVTEFNIEKLNGSRMIIKSKDCRMEFTKF